MAVTGAAAEAERVLSIGLAQADQNVSLRSRAGRAEAREILEMLERADQQLERRLRREAQRFGPTERFTGAGLLAYRRQVQLVNAFVRARMDRNSRRAARRNIRQGWFDTVGLLGGLEEAYSGSVRPLRINTARMMNERTRGVQASLLRQHATSMDRYGEVMERTMRQTLQSNLLAGGSFSQAVDQLVAMRGPRGRVSIVARELPDGTVERIRLDTIPEGLFRRHRWWAMRIVRTETAYAQNAAGFEALQAARDVDFPDMQKKILAMMDNRTYPDSIAVHGQIRDLDATFRDGAGREYLHPPARPNDREVVIPWRPGWDETETSAPRPSLEEAVDRARAERGTVTLPEGEVAELIEDEPEADRRDDLDAAREAQAAERARTPFTTRQTLDGIRGLAHHEENEERFRELLGEDVDPETINAILEAPPGYQQRNLRVRMTRRGLSMATELHDEQGNRVGIIDRAIRREEGRLVAHHEAMFIEERFQRRGIGSHFLRQQYRAYDQLGVRSIRVYAVARGRYVWARMGFQWDAATALGVRERFARYLRERVGLEQADARRVAARHADRPHEIAALEIDGERVGREFLMTDGYGHAWSGAIDFTRDSEERLRYADALGIEDG